MGTSKRLIGLKTAGQLCVLALVLSALLAAVPVEAASRAVVKSRVTAPVLNCVHQNGGTTSTLGGDRCTTHTIPVIPHNNNTTVTQRRISRYEIAWLESNITLDDRLIKLAKAEEAQTTSTEIKTFSQDLQTSLGLEVTQMQGWLQSWYNITYTPRSQGMTLSQNPFINSAAAMDLLFIDQVMGYEHSEIGLARQAVRLAGHPELKVFAEQLISEGQDVLDLVRGWQTLLERMVWEDLYGRFDRLPTPWMPR